MTWFEVYDNNVVIGFRERSADLELIVKGSALRGNKAIDFGCHVWAVPDHLRSYRPGDPGYWMEATARYGRVER